VPECIWKGNEAPLWTESLRIKGMIRGENKGHMHDYLNLTRLDNTSGTGHLPLLLETETAILVETDVFFKSSPGSEAMRRFQEKMAGKALNVLKNIR
jgi:hypothetical protein